MVRFLKISYERNQSIMDKESLIESIRTSLDRIEYLAKQNYDNTDIEEVKQEEITWLLEQIEDYV